MGYPISAPMAAALSLALIGACSKPAEQPHAAAAPGEPAAESAVSGPAAPGGVVSPPPSPANDAINANQNVGDASQAAASTSFTEGQAKDHFEKAGYTDVTGLTKTPDGLWTAKAKKDGKAMDVSLDFKGAVTAR